MPSRRHIREAVVQFLYCADLEGGANPAELRGPFWDFVTDDYVDGPVLAPPHSHPLDQTVPGPADRLPADWREQLEATR